MRFRISGGKWLVLTAIVIAAALVAPPLVYLAAFERRVEEVRGSSAERLGVYADLLRSLVETYDYLPFLVASNRTVLRLLEGRAEAVDASKLLRAIALRSGAAVAFVLDRSGTTLAASNYDEPASFVGENYAFREYFKEAMRGGEGRLYAVGATSRVPGYYLSSPIRLGGEVAGAAVIKLELSPLQESFAAGAELVIGSDPHGVVVLSSRSDWIHRALFPLSELEFERVRRERLYGDRPLVPLVANLERHGDATWGDIDGRRYLLRDTEVSDMGWRLTLLTPLAAIRGESVKPAGLVFLALSLAAFAVLFERERRLKALADERLADERRMRAIDREREESLRLLADGIAHQIRNPLLGIGGFASLIRRKKPVGAALDEHLGVIIGCCKDLEKIVGEVRDYIDLTSGETGAVEIGPALDAARAEASTVAGGDFAGWSADVEAGVVVTDPSLLNRALVEILRNSLESGDGEPVSVSVSGKQRDCPDCAAGVSPRCGKCYVLTIADNGPGISAEHLPHIAEPFFSTRPHGVGLGLAKAKRCLQIMGGRISFASPADEKSGRGVRVTLTLPAVMPSQASAEEEGGGEGAEA